MNRIADLCGRSTAGPPDAGLLRPPKDLLAHPQHEQEKQEQPRCSIFGSSEDAPGELSVNGDDGGTTTKSSSRVPLLSADSGDAPPTNAEHVAGIPADNGNNQVLILLDMNGTLLFRAKKPLRVSTKFREGWGLEQQGEEEVYKPAFVHGEPDPLQYYMRPGAVELVRAMGRHPRVQLAFYTSMRGANALPAARFLMHGDGGGDR